MGANASPLVLSRALKESPDPSVSMNMLNIVSKSNIVNELDPTAL